MNPNLCCNPPTPVPRWILTQPEAFEAAISYWQAMGWTVHIQLQPDFTLAKAASKQAWVELTARTSEGDPISDTLLVAIPYETQQDETLQDVLERIASHYDLQVLT